MPEKMTGARRRLSLKTASRVFAFELALMHALGALLLFIFLAGTKAFHVPIARSLSILDLALPIVFGLLVAAFTHRKLPPDRWRWIRIAVLSAAMAGWRVYSWVDYPPQRLPLPFPSPFLG